MKDPGYLVRVLDRGDCEISSDPERKTYLSDNADAAVWFLLGKGLTPQQVYDVLSCWWQQGHSFARTHKSKQGGDTVSID